MPLSKIRSSIYYTPEQAKRLERLAVKFELYHLRGAGKTRKIGSISRLMQAIADGELIIKVANEN